MFICIWCEDLQRGIGKNNSIPWKIKEEMDFFKNTTFNKTVVMGKNTFLSIKKPLINRKNIVISSTLKKDFNSEIIIYQNPEIFLKDYENSKEEIYIIGGKQIYDFFIPFSQKILVSKLNEKYNCWRLYTSAAADDL
ncbi:MAG: dihydrofolate reductase, partial [Malacoplasma sp.]|nr:dihydrofolate reductase [Malacoplasma sp.]